MENKNKICITLDLDWAPKYMIDKVIEKIKKNNIRCTIFATDNAKYLNSYSDNKFEIGIHPNINKIDEFENEVKKLKNMFPKAKSLRTHSLTQSSKFYKTYKKYDIKNISNYMMINAVNITPIKISNKLHEFPIYFMDDFYIANYKIADKFKLKSLNITQPGLKILCFHPIHIYLNTRNLKTYEKTKNIWAKRKLMKQHINHQKEGVGTLFDEILNYLKKEKKTSYCLNKL